MSHFFRFHLKAESGGFLEKPLEPSQKIALLISSLEVAWHNHLFSDQFVHKTCVENLVMQNLVLYFRKNFFLVESINDKINVFLQSGLVSYWIRTHMESRNFQNSNHGPKSLSLSHLSGIFNIYLICSLIACLVWLLEVSIYRIEKYSRADGRTVLN